MRSPPTAKLPAGSQQDAAAPPNATVTESALGATIAPPGILASLRTGMTRDEVATIAPSAASAPIELDHGARASLQFVGERLAAIRIELGVDAPATLTKLWGKPLAMESGGAGARLTARDLDNLVTWTRAWVWDDPIGGWLARLVEVRPTAGGAASLVLMMQRDRPDPNLTRQGEDVLERGLQLLGMPSDQAETINAKHTAPTDPAFVFPGARDGKVANVSIAFVYLDRPAAHWTWPALIAKRFGAPKLVGSGEDRKLVYASQKYNVELDDDLTNGRWILNVEVPHR